MNTYIVAVLNFFDNNNELFKVEAENEIIAVHKAVVESIKDESSKVHYIDWFNEYGCNSATAKDLIYDLTNQELSVSEPLKLEKV